jgi:ABC-type uncharacterized transport system substrate-binding protein
MIYMAKRISTFMFLLVFLFIGCNNKKELRTIGIVQLASDPPTELSKDGLIKALEDKGYKNKVNIKFIFENAQGDYNAIGKIEQRIEHNSTNIGVALSTVFLQEMIKNKTKFPVVFAAVANPFIVGAGTNDTNHLPNLTGVPSTSPIYETLVSIRQIFPRAKRIGTLYTPAEPNSVYYAQVQAEEGKNLGFSIIQKPVNSVKDMIDKLQEFKQEKVEVIYQISDILTAFGFNEVIKYANMNKIPLISNQIVQVSSGASFGLCWDFYKIGYEAGLLVDKILTGENPAKIPFKRMERIIVAVNKSAAQIQNVPLTDEILNKAGKVFH